jgi:hypothetical protein
MIHLRRSHLFVYIGEIFVYIGEIRSEK